MKKVSITLILLAILPVMTSDAIEYPKCGPLVMLGGANRACECSGGSACVGLSGVPTIYTCSDNLCCPGEYCDMSGTTSEYIAYEADYECWGPCSYPSQCNYYPVTVYYGWRTVNKCICRQQ